MRAVIQRVNSGSVAVDEKIVGSIGKGFVVLLGVNGKDTEADLLYMVDKIVNIRIFEDDNEKMNLSLMDVGGELLVVSQFTLYGDCRKGRRPSFINAAGPEKAEELYNELVKKCRELGVKTETGTFQAHMNVNIENDGPVTIIVDSEKLI
ncbi:MAG: D-aminoacyl-tRNA deacylase [Clostridiaceae bacterium]|nr:D-aminoacyl-tRNA deacylase [Clostridiaceae bacterium]